MDSGDGSFVPGSRRRGGQARPMGLCFTPAPGDVLVTCPYNPMHWGILQPRFAAHLTKCRYRHLKVMDALGREPDFGICRYDVTHHVPTMELQGHEETCPGRVQVVNHMQAMQEFDEAIEKLREECGISQAEPISSFFGATEIVGGANVNEDDDSWERESRENIRLGIQAYDPQEKLERESGNIIQSLPGLSSKSERRAFYQSQYEAFLERGGEFDDEGPSGKTNSDFTSSDPSAITQEDIPTKRAKDLMRMEKLKVVGDNHAAGRSGRDSEALVNIDKLLEKARSESACSSSSFKDRDSDLRSETSSCMTSTTVFRTDSFSSSRGK